MVKEKETLAAGAAVMHNMKGGEGDVTLMKLFTPDEYGSDTHMIGKLTIPPHAGLGYHVHEGEEELMYLLAGVGEYNDDGAVRTVAAGDACLCRMGHGHSIKNASDTEELVILAYIPAAKA